ncbi:hypothetical protein Q4F19_13240 [Sphingomonas sp. BIUV-7]|uniref:Uncharacterized protein n=1 Tax=Sphingomonas natans TaxID=3063330 RepID=A0ABT8YAI5_9SPHN|nr:hypothetical protein [Sphingomonas sp. BIUV-7]MDO6415352.1 hypothetical protein [Sphingomonas sp. BIUV-7]
MPKLTERERLAKLEADQRALAQEADRVRKTVRAGYGQLVADLAIETLSEREFRELIGHAIRVGGAASIAALKALPPALSSTKISPERRPSDEHGQAARSRPASGQDAASAGDGPGR